MLLGRYEVIRKLGVGGFGEVLLARAIGAEGFERVIALKRLKGDLARKQGSLQGIINEARIGGLLNHPNIVQVLEFVQLGPDYLLIMEYVDGLAVQELIDLDRLRTPRLLTPGLALDVAIQACEGLHYAHSARSVGGKPLKLIHRDIKPSNLMITRTGTVKIMDFGVARSATNLGQSSTGSIKGTLRYLSPEQAEGSKEIGHASDLFSLALVLCEMIIGHAVYEADQEHLVLLRALQARTGDAVKEAESLAPGLGPILTRALTPNPDDRYRTAEELAQALRALKAWFPVEYGLPALVERALVERRRSEQEDDLSTETSFSVKLRQNGLDRPRTGWEMLVPPDPSLPSMPAPAPAASPAPPPGPPPLPPVPPPPQTVDLNTARSWEWEWHITNLPPRSELESCSTEEIAFDGIVIEDFQPPEQGAVSSDGEPVLVRIDLQSPLSSEETTAISRAYREPAKPPPPALLQGAAPEPTSFDDSGIFSVATTTAMRLQVLEAQQSVAAAAAAALEAGIPQATPPPVPASSPLESGISLEFNAAEALEAAVLDPSLSSDRSPAPETVTLSRPGVVRTPDRTRVTTALAAQAGEAAPMPVAIPGGALVQPAVWPVGQFVAGLLLGMLLLGLGFVLGFQYGHRTLEGEDARSRPPAARLLGSSSELRPPPPLSADPSASRGPLEVRP